VGAEIEQNKNKDKPKKTGANIGRKRVRGRGRQAATRHFVQCSPEGLPRSALPVTQAKSDAK